MAVRDVILRSPWAQQPQGPVSIDRTLGVNQTITHCLPLNGNPNEIVRGGMLSYGAGSSRAVDARGVSLKASGSAAVASIAIDLSAYSKLTVSFWMYWNAFANDDALAMEYGANYSTNNGFLIDPNSGAPLDGSIQVGVWFAQ